MQGLRLIWLSTIYYALVTYAADGPIDFEKAPGSGVSGLRGCATLAYNPASRAGSVFDLGCKQISCLCRPDLIQKAYDLIKGAVVANCGEGADVDIAQATKVYNDYCSANGFDIPGYTYIVTVTVPFATSTDEPNTASSTGRAPDPTPGPGGSSSPNTDVGMTTTGIQNMPTAAVTVVVTRSSGTRLKPLFLFQVFLMVSSIPVKYMYAYAESLIVTHTPSPPPPAASSTVTKFVSVQGLPAISTAYEYPKSSSYSPRTITTFVTSRSNAPESSEPTENTTSGTERKSGKGGDGLTKLEIVGIVIGIITAVATTVATLWMCARGHRGKENSAPIRLLKL